MDNPSKTAARSPGGSLAAQPAPFTHWVNRKFCSILSGFLLILSPLFSRPWQPFTHFIYKPAQNCIIPEFRPSIKLNISLRIFISIENINTTPAGAMPGTKLTSRPYALFTVLCSTFSAGLCFPGRLSGFEGNNLFYCEKPVRYGNHMAGTGNPLRR